MLWMRQLNNNLKHYHPNDFSFFSFSNNKNINLINLVALFVIIASSIRTFIFDPEIIKEYFSLSHVVIFSGFTLI
jgi:hypothetical protein